MEFARLAAEEVAEVTQDKAALRHLLRKRKDSARAYFDELAGRFGKDYVPGRSWKALAEALIKVLNYKTVADLGAGEGTLSQLLAQRAEKVIAVDLSPKMVEYGQKLALDNGLSNLEIGAALQISSRTVGTHIEHILDKLGAPNRAAAAARAITEGLILGQVKRFD